MKPALGWGRRAADGARCPSRSRRRRAARRRSDDGEPASRGPAGETVGAAGTKAREVAALLARAGAARDGVAGAARLAEEDPRRRARAGVRASAAGEQGRAHGRQQPDRATATHRRSLGDELSRVRQRVLRPDPRSRLARTHGHPETGPRRGRDARLRPAGHARDGQDPRAARRRRPRLRDGARQHLPSDARAGARARRRAGRPARVDALAGADHHRLGRLSGLLDGLRGRGRRDQGPPANERCRRCRADQQRRRRAARVDPGDQGGGVRFRSYLDGGERFMGPETSMEVQAALGSDIALVFDECTPFHVSATTSRARCSAPTAGWSAAWTGTSSPVRPIRRSTGSSRAAPSATCGSSRRRSWRPVAATGSRSAARSARTRRRCTRWSTGPRPSSSASPPTGPATCSASARSTT